VVDHYDLKREVVSTAMNYLDRYLGSYQGIMGKNLFQLLSMTCLYLSIKLTEADPLIIEGSRSSMDTILQLSNGIFTLKEMETLERELLQTLQWRVHPPTSQLFVGHFLLCTRSLSVSSLSSISIMGEDKQKEIHDIAAFTVELSVMDYFFITYKNSDIAIAALLNAMDQLLLGHNNQKNTQIQRDFISYTNALGCVDTHSPAFLACRERLSLIYKQANEDEVMEGEDLLIEENDTAMIGTESPVGVPESPQVQRTIISPTSVVTPPENTNETRDIFQQQEQEQQQQMNKQHQYSSSSAEDFDNDTIINDLFFEQYQ